MQKTTYAKAGIQGQEGRIQMKIKKEPVSKFIKVRCPKCRNEQIMFGKASTVVKCLVCGRVLSDTSGGKSRIKARILEVLE
jgi:small subunit ribosomal protein S27e